MDGGWVEPMLATAGPLPDGENWAYEVKWDGIRGLAGASADGVQLWSRNRRDLTADYPELARLRLPPRLLLDTAIVALDEHGVSDFELLQQRLHHTRPSPALVESVPVSLMVFDVLRVDDAWQLDHPYSHRRGLLDEFELATPGRLAVPPHFTDVAAADVLAAVETQGLEGVVAKRLSSRYEQGRRSRAWIKHAIRHIRKGSDGALTTSSHVTTGFSRELYRDMCRKLPDCQNSARDGGRRL